MWLEQGIKRLRETPSTILRKVGDSRVAHVILRDIIMPRMEPKIFSAIHPEYPDEFDQTYQDLIQQGYLPIVLMNHQSHGDGIPASIVNKRLTELARAATPEQPLKGFQLVIASSTVDGATGGFLRDLTNYLLPHFAARHTHLIPYTTRADQIRYHTPSNRIEVMRKMKTAISENYGLGFFPEAHMTGGRLISWWRFWEGINGMQHFDKEEFHLNVIRRIAHEHGRKVAFILVGIDGGYKLLSPDVKLPNTQALTGIFQDTPPELVHVKVDIPMPEEKLDAMTIELNEDPNIILAKAIAQLLPIEGQGVYRNQAETPKLPRRDTIFSRAVDLFRRGS